MNKCENCGYTTENAIRFCPFCGKQLMAREPVCPPAPEQPVQPAPHVEVPQYPYEAPLPMATPAYPATCGTAPQPKVSKAKKIVGMGLSIGGFVFALIGLLYGLLFAFIDSYTSIFMSVYLAAFSIPLSAVGLSFSSAAKKAGDTSVFSRLGKIFGLLGIILTGVSVLVSITSAMAGAESFFYKYDDYYDPFEYYY